MPDLRIAFLLSLLALGSPVFSEEAGATATAGKEGVPIIFLPPPLDGTVSFSIGIYSAAGKLVRVLHRESPQEDFTVGENGLIARWDGKNDAGQPVRVWTLGHRVMDGVENACRGNVTVKCAEHRGLLPGQTTQPIAGHDGEYGSLIPLVRR